MRYKKWALHLHRDDKWIDEIRLNGVASTPLLRLKTNYQYKTIGLSGGEWRVSTMWQSQRSLMLISGAQSSDDGNWNNFDGPYYTIESACAALYPGLYNSQKHAHNVLIESIDFVRKGRILYRSSLDGIAVPLLTAAGHLPWAWLQACDQPLDTDEAWADHARLCHQVGCAAEAVSTYKLLILHENYFEERSAVTDIFDEGVLHKKVGLVHRFCAKHLRRGDCGLEDADENYEVVEGQGPQGAQGFGEYISESIQGRVVEILEDDGEDHGPVSA